MDVAGGIDQVHRPNHAETGLLCVICRTPGWRISEPDRSSCRASRRGKVKDQRVHHFGLASRGR